MFTLKKFLLVMMAIVLVFCSNENTDTQISLNNCIENILSPTDYEKFLNKEITLEPYQELIDECLAGNLEISSVSNTAVEVNEVENKETTTTSLAFTIQPVKGFTSEATNASDKWPMIYKFENIVDESSDYKFSTTVNIIGTRVEEIKLVFQSCQSNVYKFATVDIEQNELAEFKNKDCNQNLSIQSFQYLEIKNLNDTIRLYLDKKYTHENTQNTIYGCCHELNLGYLVNEYIKSVKTYFTTTTTSTTTTTVPPTTTTTLPKFTNKELEFYVDSYSSNNGFNYLDRFLRWQYENVSIAVQGYYSTYQLNILKEAVISLNENTPGVNFYLINSTEGNIDFYFYNHSEWNKEFCTANSSYRRFGSYDFDSSFNSISKSVLCVMPEDSYKTFLPTATSNQLKDCIASDLYYLIGYAATGSIGNANNSTYGDNIFSMEYCNVTTSFTSLDKRMLRLIYDDRVKNSKTKAEVVEFFTNN